MIKPIETLRGLKETVSDSYHNIRSSARRAAGIGLIGLSTAGAYACTDSDPIGPIDGCKGAECVQKTDTLFVQKTDTLNKYVLAVPFKVEAYEAATICPPNNAQTGGTGWSRFEFELRGQSPFLLSNSMYVEPAHFSNGCPDQKPYQTPVGPTIGHQMNLLLVDRTGTSAFHGNIVEGAYITYEQANGQPGAAERGLPASATHWKVQFARQLRPDPQGFTRAIREGAYLVMRDRITGQEYSSQTSAEHRIPITGPYITGTRLKLDENPANWTRATYNTQAQADSALRAIVVGTKAQLPPQ